MVPLVHLGRYRGFSTAFCAVPGPLKVRTFLYLARRIAIGSPLTIYKSGGSLFL